MKIIKENNKTYYVLEYNDTKFTSIENLLAYTMLLIKSQTKELNYIINEYNNVPHNSSVLKIRIRVITKRINSLLEEYESMLTIIK